MFCFLSNSAEFLTLHLSKQFCLKPRQQAILLNCALGDVPLQEKKPHLITSIDDMLNPGKLWPQKELLKFFTSLRLI
jgi:hypothetical protein